MNAAFLARLKDLEHKVECERKKLEELNEQVKKLTEKRPVGRPPKNG